MFRPFILLLALTTLVSAREIRVTPQSAGAYAIAHHPGLAAARFRIEEARGRLQQSGRLSNPELEIDFTRHKLDPEGGVTVAFMQRFPLTARLRHEKAVSRAGLAAAEAEVRDAERKIAAEAGIAAVRMLALSGQRELRARQLGHSRELSSFLLKRVETGEASAVDASQVELESRQIEIENLQLAADETVLLGELRPLLGVRGEDRVTVAGALPAPATPPAGGFGAARPDIVAAEARAEAAKSVVLEQRARRWEDFGLGVSYARERELDEPEPLATEQIVGLHFRLPLPLWNSNAGRIREAEAAARRATQELAATKVTASAEVASAHSAMGAYARLIGELDAKVLPAALQIEEQLRQSYATGQTPLTDILRARARRLELQRTRLDALRDYHLARIRHAAATATMPAARLPSTK